MKSACSLALNMIVVGSFIGGSGEVQSTPSSRGEEAESSHLGMSIIRANLNDPQRLKDVFVKVVKPNTENLCAVVAEVVLVAGTVDRYRNFLYHMGIRGDLRELKMSDLTSSQKSALDVLRVNNFSEDDFKGFNSNTILAICTPLLS